MSDDSAKNFTRAAKSVSSAGGEIVIMNVALWKNNLTVVKDVTIS
jgi:hypothetical protein